MFNNSLEKNLIEMGADIRAISLKVSTIGNSVDDLSKIVYSDKDSLSNRTLVIAQKVDDIQDEIHDHNKAIEAQHFRLTKLEKETNDLSRDAERRAKHINIILTAIMSCLVPLMLTGAVAIIQNSGVSTKEVIIRNE